MNKKIGENIRKARLTKKLTQEELATICSISLSSLNKYERDERYPKLETLIKIADALDVQTYGLTHANSVTFELIQIFISILKENALTLIEKNTKISTKIIENIINYPYEDLSITEQKTLLKYLEELDSELCKKFCKDNLFYGSMEITGFMIDILHKEENISSHISVPGQYILDKDAFYKMIKTRVLDISNYYQFNIDENEIKNIITQIDFIIDSELFKKHNIDPGLYDQPDFFDKYGEI
jgi:transcriptional regulator with XRE-family HTH domain